MQIFTFEQFLLDLPKLSTTARGSYVADNFTEVQLKQLKKVLVIQICHSLDFKLDGQV
jgi:hypothetical protein